MKMPTLSLFLVIEEFDVLCYQSSILIWRDDTSMLYSEISYPLQFLLGSKQMKGVMVKNWMRSGFNIQLQLYLKLKHIFRYHQKCENVASVMAEKP